MWVQFHNLPLGMMNQVYNEKFEKIVGDVEDIDVDKNGIGWGPNLKIKIWIIITKLLFRGIMINHEGQ